MLASQIEQFLLRPEEFGGYSVVETGSLSDLHWLAFYSL
jgi:hypothetical protein